MLAAALGLLALGAVADSSAEPPPPAPRVALERATLTQRSSELLLQVKLTVPLSVGKLEPAQGRQICALLDPSKPGLRTQKLCFRRGSAERLRATVSTISRGGRSGRATGLRGARARIDGRYLSLAFPPGSAAFELGTAIRWQVLLTWRDGGPCEQSPAAVACTQRLPRGAAGKLRTEPVSPLGGSPPAHLRLLATGDSMMQIVDSFLIQRLRPLGVSVRNETHISTGLTKPAMLNWIRKSRSQAAQLRPHVSVVFIGANDGYPMRTRGGRTTPCCNQQWIEEYARRTRQMMNAYRRGGRSLVYWLTLPTPRRPCFALIYRAVNSAIRLAARSYPNQVRVVDLESVFTPRQRYRPTIVFRGRRIRARAGDGVHLSTAGASVAATLIAKQLRADRALSGGPPRATAAARALGADWTPPARSARDRHTRCGLLAAD